MSYISNTGSDVKAMLGAIGVRSVDTLFEDIPPEIRIRNLSGIPSALSEFEADSLMKKIARENRGLFCLAGAGSYSHHVPAAVDHLSSRSEFFTAYTPYQPEVSQGTLAAIFEYQTMICRLTGMDVANASMYDGATLCAEACLMAVRSSGKRKILIAGTVHPHYREVLLTYARAAEIEMMETAPSEGVISCDRFDRVVDDETAAVVIQSPNFFGLIEDVNRIAGCAHDKGALVIVVVAEAMSLGLLRAPGELGADIVCGEGQSFGNYPGFGGPGLGILAVKEKFMRRIPGRLVGKTVDAEGNTAFCLTLQTREQHIRRENATSNICSNEGLCALRAAIYLSLQGKNLRSLAEFNHRLTRYLEKRLSGIGITTVFSRPFFNEILVRCPDADRVMSAMRDEGYLFGVNIAEWYPDMQDCILLCCTECVSVEEIDRMVETLGRVRGRI